MEVLIDLASEKIEPNQSLSWKICTRAVSEPEGLLDFILTSLTEYFGAQRSIIKSSSERVAKITTASADPSVKTLIIIPINPTKSLNIINFSINGDVNGLKEVLPIIPIIQRLLIGSKSSHSAGSMIKKSEIRDVKDSFFAAMSHELRTPLNGIVGMVTMLQDAGPLNSKQQDYLKILMQCSHQLMNLMNNILDFSKMASNRLVLVKNPVDIREAIRNSVNMVEGKALSKKLNLKVDVPPNLPIIVGDFQRLVQIISNLLSNAVKFTNTGSITLSAVASIVSHPISTFPATSSGSCLLKRWKITFTVADTGIGIPERDIDRIFDLFQQGSQNDRTDQQGGNGDGGKGSKINTGTGLGLTIVRELVKLMDGEVSVTSQPGKGSVFTFYILVDEEIDIKGMKTKHRELIKDAKVLVVDDRAEYRLQLADLLLGWECIPSVVSSGEEVLKYLAHGLVFDLIIVDICMPYMSGIELAQELKSKYAKIPLIGLSSIDLDAGIELFDYYMNKPIDQNSLFPAVLGCLILSSTSKDSLAPPPLPITTPRKRAPKPKKKLRILIAEDDDVNAFTLKEMLRYLGYSSSRIRAVVNGELCVAEAQRRHYDVILMDILMPVMDGWEATKHIRQMQNRPYIIAVSAAVQNSDKAKCQEVGIDGYLAKPVLKDKLEAALAPLVEK